MKEMSITEKLHMQFYKCNKLLKRNVFEHHMEHIKAVPYKGQGRILKLLLDKGELSQKDIVIEMDIRPSTAWELVNKLDHAGFVEKIPNPDDKRGTIIKLTENGKKEALSAKWDLGNISCELYSALTSEEQYQLSGLLEKLILSLKKTENHIESESEFCFDNDNEEMRAEGSFCNELKKDLHNSRQIFKDMFRDFGRLKKKSNEKFETGEKNTDEGSDNIIIDITEKK